MSIKSRNMTPPKILICKSELWSSNSAAMVDPVSCSKRKATGARAIGLGRVQERLATLNSTDLYRGLRVRLPHMPNEYSLAEVDN